MENLDEHLLDSEIRDICEMGTSQDRVLNLVKKYYELGKAQSKQVKGVRGECYDFYYSKKQTEHFKILNEGIFFNDLIRETTVDGIPYTEMILKGNKPVSKFDDLKLVYSANVYKINIRDL